MKLKCYILPQLIFSLLQLKIFIVTFKHASARPPTPKEYLTGQRWRLEMRNNKDVQMLLFGEESPNKLSQKKARWNRLFGCSTDDLVCDLIMKPDGKFILRSEANRPSRSNDIEGSVTIHNGGKESTTTNGEVVKETPEDFASLMIEMNDPFENTRNSTSPSTSHNISQSSTLQTVGRWRVHQNPYCLTDRHFDEVILSVTPNKGDKKKDSDDVKSIPSYSRLEFRCKLWGRFSIGTSTFFHRSHHLGRMTHGRILGVKKTMVKQQTTKDEKFFRKSRTDIISTFQAIPESK